MTKTFQASGGTSPYTFSVVSGAGSIDASTGLYTAPSQAGSATIRVTDHAGLHADASVTTNAQLAFASSSAAMDVGRSITLQANGGTAPYSYSVLSGGGTIAASTGDYTAPATAGNVVVQVTDSLNATAQIAITVNSMLGLNPAQPIDGTQSQQLVATGGTGPYSYSVISGPGSVDPTTGVFTAPAAAGSTVVQIADAVGATAQVTITNNAAVTISPASVTMTAGAGQSFPFSGVGGTPPYTYSLVSGPGSLTAGGTFSSSNASGTAVIRVTDALGINATATAQVLRIRVNGAVKSVVTDGTSWYLGGSFTAVNPYSAPRLLVADLSSGDPSLACDLQSGFLTGTVEAIAMSPTGIYVGGQFTSYRGIPVANFVKINPSTCDLDPTFNQGPATSVPGEVAALLLSGNSLYVAGAFNRYRGVAVHGVVKIDATTGALDPVFSQASGNGWAGSLALVGNSLFVGGSFQSYDGAAVAYLAKVDATTGHVDPTFAGNTKPDGAVFTLLASGTTLYAAGAFSHLGPTPASVAKFDAGTGALDTGFTAALAPYGGLTHTLAMVGNSIYVGRDLNGGSVYGVALAKADAVTGAIDTSFTQANAFDDAVTKLVSNGGSLFVGGSFQNYRNVHFGGLAKLDPITGNPDVTNYTGTGFNDSILDMGILNNQIWIGGAFSTYRGTAAFHLAKFDVAGDHFDPTLSGAGGTDRAVTTLTLYNGSLYVAGDFNRYGGGVANGLAKIDPATGALDTNFAAYANVSEVETIVPLAGALYLGGFQTGYGGTPTGPVVKIDPVTGVLDSNFNANLASATSTTRWVGGLSASGGSLFAGGYFASEGASPAINLAKIDAATGALDTTFTQASGVGGTTGSDFVQSVVVDGTSLYLAGAFATYRGTPVAGVAKVDTVSGAADTTFTRPIGIPATSYVATLSVTPTSLYLGGTFDTYQGAGAQRLAKISKTSGAIDTTFTVTPGACDAPDGHNGCGGLVYSIVPLGARVYVGGRISLYRGKPSYFFFPVDAVTGAPLDP